MAELEVHFPDGLVGFKPLTEEKPLIVGKGATADILIDQPKISAEHFIIQWQRNGFHIRVTGKGRNVRLNGKVIRFGVLKPDDELTLSQYRFIVRAKPGENIYDPMDFQFDAQALGQVEEEGVELPSKRRSGKKKPAKEYYVPLYRSPLFIGITGTLLSLCVIGLALFLWVRSRSAEKQYDAAMEDVSSGLYASAIRRFDRFLEAFPEGELAEQAVVWRAIARVQQFSEGSVGDWENAFKAAQQMYDESSELPFYRERGKDVFELIHKIGMGLAEAAKSRADANMLAMARESVGFAERFVPSEFVRPEGISTIQAAIQEAEFVIDKDVYRSQMLAKMQESLAAGKPLQVYEFHQQLYGRYPDLATDEEMLQQRENARQIERKQISFVEDTSLAAAPETDEVVAASWTLVRRTAKPDVKVTGEFVTVPVKDSVYAVDGGSGEVKWRYPIGYAASFLPTTVPGDSTRLLVHSSKNNRLELLDAKTGEPMWSRDLGERAPLFGSTPLIRRGRIFLYVVHAKDPDVGRMLVLQLQSGASVGEYVFPQAIVGSPVLDSRRDGILVLGQWASLYDLSIPDQECRRVVGLDHESGAICAHPLLAGRFLFVVENLGRGKSRLRCLVVSEREGAVREKQQVELSGEVWTSPAVVGGRLFATTDKGLLYAYELGAEVDPKPLTPLASPPDSRTPSGFQPIPFPVDEQNCWTVGDDLRWIPFRLGETAAGPEWETKLPGLPVCPPASQAELLIVASNDPREDQVVVRAFNVRSKEVVWECQLGKHPEAIRSEPDGTSLQWFDRQGGRTLGLDQLAEDHLEETPVPERDANQEKQRQITLRTLSEWTDGVVQWGGIGQNRLMYFPPGERGRETVLPCVVSGKPAVLDEGLLIPGTDGFLYWIDPKTGKELAEPFMGPYLEGRPCRLRSVTAVDASTVIVVADQQVLRLRLVETPYRHFEPSASADLESVAATQLVNLEDRIFMAHGSELVSLQPETLEILDRWSLDAHVSKPPVSIGKNVLFVTEQNQVICLGGTKGQINILWKWQLEAPPVGQPLATSEGFWIASSAGRLYKHALDDHEILQEIQVGRAIVDGPWPIGDRLAVLAGDGSVATVPTD